jgi:hypothetical protein
MTTYYHGGVIGLRVGQYILPPAETGAFSVADCASAPEAEQAQIERVHRKDRVYLATDKRIAMLWAALYPLGTAAEGGWVYRVEPEGEVEPDPDYLADDGKSVCAPRARVVGIVKTGVPRRYAGPLIGEVA